MSPLAYLKKRDSMYGCGAEVPQSQEMQCNKLHKLLTGEKIMQPLH